MNATITIDLIDVTAEELDHIVWKVESAIGDYKPDIDTITNEPGDTPA